MQCFSSDDEPVIKRRQPAAEQTYLDDFISQRLPCARERRKEEKKSVN